MIALSRIAVTVHGFSSVTGVAPLSDGVILGSVTVDDIDHAAGDNAAFWQCRFLEGATQSAITDNKFKRRGRFLRGQLTHTKKLSLLLLHDQLIFELRGVARRIAVVVLDGGATGDDLASRPDLRESGFGG